MVDRIAAFITGEGNWLPVAMTIAAAAVALRWGSSAAGRDRVMASMNLFVGLTLLVMGGGHLLAVVIHHARGDLNGPPALLYVIGIAIVMPSTLIVMRAHRSPVAALNGWMAATLVVLGFINIPLAIPPLLNIAYGRSRGRTAAIIAATYVVVNLALFAGGLLFMLSGARTFEEWRAG